MILPCKKPDLYDYAPHQENMLLIDQLHSFDFDQTSIHCSVKVNPNSEFYDHKEQGVAIWFTFEYMAQSIGIYNTIKAKTLNGPTKIGFLLGIRDFIAHENYLPNDAQVDIFVKQEYMDNSIVVFEGITKVNGKEYSKATITAAEANPEIINKMQ